MRAGQGRTSALAYLQVISNGPIIAGGQLENLKGKPLSHFQGGTASIFGHHLKQFFIISGVGDHRDRGVIFSSAAQHGGPTNVDVLNGLFQSDTLTGYGLAEGVKIDDDQVDRPDLVGCHLGDVLWVVATEKQTTVDHRVEGLNSSVEHLGKPRILGDILNREARFP